MIFFRKVRWKNLLSTGNRFTEIQLDQNPTTLIVGKNGAGKSTILDALTFGLFGKPYRNINKPQLLNTLNQRDLLVEVEFTIGRKHYMVRRGIKPSIFEIWVNGDLLDQDAKNKDYQKHFEQNILKLNFKSFTQVVVLGSSTFVPFMQLKAAERRHLIEDLLDITIFSKMNKVLKNRFDEAKDKWNDLIMKQELASQKKELQEQHLQDQISDKEKRIQDLNDKVSVDKNLIKSTEENINQSRKEIKKQTDILTTSEKDRQRIDKLREYEVKIRTNRQGAYKSVEFYSNNDACPTCEQEISDNFKKEMISKKSEKLKTFDEGLKKLSEKLEEANNRIREIETAAQAISDLQSKISGYESQIQVLRRNIDSLNSDVEKLKNTKGSVDEYKKNIQKIEAEIKELDDQKQTLIEFKHYLEIVQMMLKDTGIKTRIIRKYLPIINKLVNKYLSDMDFFVNFHLDENFKENIKSRGRDEFSYESFSEGEKLRIDLSLLFTWREVARMKNSASTNLLILDEIFDSSLDADGVEDFMKLLGQMGSRLNTFLISHKTDQISDKFDQVIKFEKQKSYSVIAGV